MSTALTPRPVWTPTLATLPDANRVLITAVRVDEIVFDRVVVDGEAVITLSASHGVPFSGYDPENDDLPEVATLVAAIANPPAPPAPVIVLSPLEILSRMTPAEEAALNTSTELAVQIVKTRLGAASDIRSDDPRTDQGKAILIAYGILTTERAAAIFA